ncbi:DUF4413 domain-containing protein, partial [Cephalotus follicularis]
VLDPRRKMKFVEFGLSKMYENEDELKKEMIKKVEDIVNSLFGEYRSVLDSFRSSLTPTIVEFLICSQDWLRSSQQINVEEAFKDLEKFEIDNFYIFALLLVIQLYL